MKVKGVGRAFFNLWFLIAPIAATKWLNFQFDIAEALDNLDRGESGISDLEYCVAMGLILVIFIVFALLMLPPWPPK